MHDSGKKFLLFFDGYRAGNCYLLILVNLDLIKHKQFLFIMFIINLNYIVPLDDLDRHMKAHVVFLKKYYRENKFVASGRKVPRTGGIILAVAESREEVENIIQEDPFYIHKLAEFTITEFLTSQYHPQLEALLKK